MNAAAVPRPNPGHLKLELSVRGMRLAESACAHADVQRALRFSAEMDGRVELVLPEDVWVNVSIDERVAADSPFLLSSNGEQLTLQREDNCVDVRVAVPPNFCDLTTSSGRPMLEVGTTYGNFIALNPASACGFSLRGVPCGFCRSGTPAAVHDRVPLSVADVIEVVRAAFAEGAAEFVYFNCAYGGGEDAGILALEPCIEAIKKHFDTLVAVQMHPPKTNRWVDRTYAMGVDAVSYNVEIHDRDALARRCAGRVRYIGRERYYEALAYAAGVFPSGTVWSDLIFGLEPAESTVRGIDALVGIGVLPVLSTFRPAAAELRTTALPSVDEVSPVFAHLFHAVRQAKINMGWVRDLSFAVTPLEARFFAGDAARAGSALRQFYRSKLGTLAARSLSRMRRRLRVRMVSDSFDASRL
jgi:hypothetical protein